jgi:hypothetical protein
VQVSHAKIVMPLNSGVILWQFRMGKNKKAAFQQVQMKILNISILKGHNVLTKFCYAKECWKKVIM